jgi:hypothetical protein
MKKPITHGRVTRWLLLLQEFDVSIIDKSVKDNVVVDFLSRLTSDNDALPIEDSFLDEHIFSIFGHTVWYANITNNLAMGKLPSHLSPREYQCIIKKSARHSWLNDYIFYTGSHLVI